MSTNSNVKPYSSYTSADLPIDCLKIIQNPLFQEKITMYLKPWTVQDCDDNPSTIFVFNDNDENKGYEDQSVIRDKKNSIGIPTKKNQSNEESSFYTDLCLQHNCENVFNAIINLIRLSEKYDMILFSYDGFSTDFARYPDISPLTLKFIEDIINDCFGIEYEKYRTECGIDVIVSLG
jgi:hypothetical protein